MIRIDLKRFIAPACMLLLTIVGLQGCRSIPEAESPRAETIESMAERIVQLEDREQIRRLLTDYGLCLDRRDFIAFSNLFSETDGEWIGGMGKAKGRQAIVALMEDKIGNPSEETVADNFHLFMNETIDLDGNRAHAETKWIFVVRNDEGRPEPFYLGHYADELIKKNGRWKFLRRVVYSEIPEDDPSTNL
ncbi:MAG: nuclear transport factor 2 family protein [Acidobacteriota bacterium]|jgi:hypothetical protein